MAESARLKAEKRSPRSKHLALSFEAAQNALQRSHESKRLEGHISIPSNIYQNKSSPNRAARQTALFSNARSSTSGQSYKNALSSRRQAGEFSAVEKTDQEYSRQRTGHHHLRGYGSRRQEDFGLKSNLNDKGEQYQALSITLTGQASNAQPLSCNYPGRKPAADVPDTVPYTTPASEFLYGTSVVIAALKFSGRKFYKLYSYVSLDRANRGQDEAIRSLARSQGVEVKQVEGAWLRILDKMSSGRPHNGYILEASPLPKIPVASLQSVGSPQDSFHGNLDHQSREEETINGISGTINYNGRKARYPVVLMLDGIVDPGNLGALLRTAYFFGIDAVAISSRNCAPLSPVTLKASAGASESMRLLSVDQPLRLVDESQRNGWKFYAAVAPNESSANRRHKQPSFLASSLGFPSRAHPCVLMLGGEGEGLRQNLLRKADFLVTIEGQRLRQGGVDSLNVSVAAGVLCEAFLRQPADSMAYNSSTHQLIDLSNYSGCATATNLKRQTFRVISNGDISKAENILF